MVTKDYKDADGVQIVLKRPTWRDFTRIASMVEQLLDVEPSVAFTVPEFEDVLRAGVHKVGDTQIRSTRRKTIKDDQGIETLAGKPDAFDEWLEQADYQEVVKLWDAVVKHGEYVPFYEKRAKDHQARVQKRQEREIRETVKMIEKLKSEGVLPPEWSIASALTAVMNGDPNLMQQLESSTSTPASTDGPDET